MCVGGPNPRHHNGPASGTGPARGACLKLRSCRVCPQLKPFDAAFYGVRLQGLLEAVFAAAEARGGHVAA